MAFPFVILLFSFTVNTFNTDLLIISSWTYHLITYCCFINVGSTLYAVSQNKLRQWYARDSIFSLVPTGTTTNVKFFFLDLFWKEQLHYELSNIKDRWHNLAGNWMNEELISSVSCFFLLIVLGGCQHWFKIHERQVFVIYM